MLSDDSMQSDLGTKRSSLLQSLVSKESEDAHKIQAAQDDSEENNSKRADLAKRQLQTKRSGAGIQIPSKHSVDDLVLELAKNHVS